MSSPQTTLARHAGAALGAALLLAAALGGAFAERASGQDRNFAGSAQGSYLFVPTDPMARDQAFDGFTTELSLKIAADISDHVSAQVKTCYGCHGFEIGMAFVDLRVSDELNFRVGRFNPSFGEFPLRHDPANHRTIDKPLPYDMGRMLRMREWNMSILPVPYVDGGLEINGSHWFGDSLQFDYAAYAVGGLRGASGATDLDYKQSRSSALYYVDNNSTPAVGARVGVTADVGDTGMVSLGLSGMYGTYDPDNELSYAIGGVDALARFESLTIRAEYLIRRTEMALGDDPVSRFRYGPGEDGDFADFFLKDGFYVESELELDSALYVLGRVDGMRRLGNVLRNEELRSRSGILRYTAGVNIVPVNSVRIKLAAQYYDFSDFDDEITLQLGVSASF